MKHYLFTYTWWRSTPGGQERGFGNAAFTIETLDVKTIRGVERHLSSNGWRDCIVLNIIPIEGDAQ